MGGATYLPELYKRGKWLPALQTSLRSCKRVQGGLCVWVCCRPLYRAMQHDQKAVFSIFNLHFLSGFFLFSSCSRAREGQNQLAGSQLQFWTVPLALRAFLSSLQGPQIVCVTQQWAQTMQRRQLCTSLLVSPGFSPRFLYLILCVRVFCLCVHLCTICVRLPEEMVSIHVGAGN